MGLDKYNPTYVPSVSNAEFTNIDTIYPQEIKSKNSGDDDGNNKPHL